jgi:hypothetical protein
VVANGDVVFNSTVTSEGQIVPFDATVTLTAGSTVCRLRPAPFHAGKVTTKAAQLSALISCPGAVWNTPRGNRRLPQIPSLINRHLHHSGANLY